MTCLLYAISGFPNVLGYIDGSHVRIIINKSTSRQIQYRYSMS